MLLSSKHFELIDSQLLCPSDLYENLQGECEKEKQDPHRPQPWKMEWMFQFANQRL